MTIDDLRPTLRQLHATIDDVRGVFDPDQLRRRLSELERQSADSSLWSDPWQAKKLLQERAHLERELTTWQTLERDVGDLDALLDLAEEEQDASLESDIRGQLDALTRQAESLKTEAMLSGEHDASSAIVQIHPGAGGTESQDWAQMLLRMYLRWAERHDYKSQMLDLQPGEEAGIKDATFAVNGPYAYGYLRAEAGIHRLVRISPFDANKRRHTSFASVTVYPDIEGEIDIVINENDLRIDTYRASSAGGQHVNKTSSAIRITHLPSGIVVQSQNERSQHQNKANAMKVLKARLYELERQKQEAALQKVVGEKKDIAWGSQIRSYVFAPYQMVKDHRTAVESGNITAVMDGAIDPFIQGYLLRAAAGDGRAPAEDRETSDEP
ncbi:MAG TPA: peptide chain release factor 2 [Nitrospiria bacterium]|nr:peptide chain release factor 2 [Nitrospiria bacterium]